MEPIDFFSTMPRMRVVQGSTAPVFSIKPTNAGTALADCSMRFILEDKRIPGSIALTKTCTFHADPEGDYFTIRLTSTDTADLCGTFTMYFILQDSSGLDYKNLIGTLEIMPSPVEESE